MPGNVTLTTQPGQPGRWMELHSDAPFSEKNFLIGRVPTLDRFVACFRGRFSCWMESGVGRSVAEVPTETQFLLARLKDGNYLAMIALVDGAFRSSLAGNAEGRLQVLAESGDTQTTTNRVTCLYLEAGRDPFALIHSASARVRARFHPEEITATPQMPDFARYFGWCSWNAFYRNVSQAGVMQIMDEFARGGVSPGFVVLDDGWQPAGKNKALGGYEAVAQQFPGGLAALVRGLKETNHVARVLAWQAFNGTFTGADAEALPAIGIEMIKPQVPTWFKWGNGKREAGTTIDTVKGRFYPESYRKPIGEPDLGRFYSTYHSFLRDCGVDGVKIDAMTWVETLGEGRGGRVRAMRELVDAAAHSGREYFDHNLIWCSSCSSDCILQAPRSAVMRSSTDFFPDKPESHGRHIINNALNSLWMGEFVIPDWDMFQTHNHTGAFHAAARAISGGPVYISDELGKTDFTLLRKLVLSDRTVPLCLGPARPTEDSLFVDPAAKPSLFKIFNLTPAGGGVLGVFNCGYDPATNRLVRGEARVADVAGLVGKDFAVFANQTGSLRRVSRTDRLPLALRELEFEILTIAPIEDGFAAIGLADKLNSGGCIAAIRRGENGRTEVDLRDGGEFLAWSAHNPQSVQLNSQPQSFRYDAATGALRVSIPQGGTLVFQIAAKPHND